MFKRDSSETRKVNLQGKRGRTKPNVNMDSDKYIAKQNCFENLFFLSFTKANLKGFAKIKISWDFNGHLK